MIAKTPVEISDAEAARKVMRLVDVLEEHDDVQNVYTNFEISDEVASKLEDE
jgi:transcriptional/translational regulatory protein YebC/TACO1